MLQIKKTTTKNQNRTKKIDTLWIDETTILKTWPKDEVFMSQLESSNKLETSSLSPSATAG